MKCPLCVVLVSGALSATSYADALEVFGPEGSRPATVRWKDCLSQKPEWYGSEEAIRIADNVLLYQRASGGWPKNIEMAEPLSDAERSVIAEWKKRGETTIDNGASHRQVAYLARLYKSTNRDRFREGLLKGLDYLLAAQYESGGWPQFFPDPKNYQKHITFNDDAMVSVLELLREVASGMEPFAFLDAERRARAGEAVRKGVECILRCQVATDGRRTVWCAQHDERTLMPAPARAYEKASLSGSESVGIVVFLIGIEDPGSDVIAAVDAAAAWFEKAKLPGIRVVEKPDSSLPKGHDTVVVKDPSAPPLWARFYELGTDRPIFCGRDGVVKYSLAEIEHERRVGYSWYTSRPARLLEKEYPAWKARLGSKARAGKTDE